MPPSAALRFVAALAFLHLLSVVAVLWAHAGQGASTAAATLRFYRSFTGTFRDYTFFAPDIASDYKAAFLVEDKTGSTLVRLGGDHREISLRYDALIAACMSKDAGRDLFARSWAALLLGAHPNATRVTVMVSRLAIPRMGDYRAGLRPTWANVYAGEFDRSPASPRAGTGPR